MFKRTPAEVQEIIIIAKLNKLDITGGLFRNSPIELKRTITTAKRSSIP